MYMEAPLGDACFTGRLVLHFVGACVGEYSNLKKILRTRKNMMMHSKERVDVVVHLHDPTDPSTERTRLAR